MARTSIEDRIVIDVPPQEPVDQRQEVAALRSLLLAEPRQISAKYFYDEYGSDLFERITELPEYYQTRTESALLAAIADRLMRITGAEELVEIGAGAATKTRILLDAMQRCGQLRRFVPLDISDATLRRVAEEITAEYPDLLVHAIVGDFMHHLEHLPAGGRRLAIFLGGTIGNLRPEPEAVTFLHAIADELDPDDHFLLGADLIKEKAVVEAAYNDSAGVTADFNRNALRVVNHRFDADFDAETFRHRAIFDEEEHRIEMWLVSTCAQTVRVDAADLTLDLAEGEGIRTEISTKYDRPKIEALLAKGGFELVDWFSDDEDLFSLSLARRAR